MDGSGYNKYVFQIKPPLNPVVGSRRPSMLMLVRSAAALATMRPVLHINTAFMPGRFNFLTLTNPADPAGTCFPNWHPCTKDVRTAEVIPEP